MEAAHQGAAEGKGACKAVTATEPRVVSVVFVLLLKWQFFVLLLKCQVE